MSFKKGALLLLSGVGLFSVANFSAEVGTARNRHRIFADGRFWTIAHRGFSGRYPEATILAFDEAVQVGIDALEFDVHATRDGRIVVIHDETVDRTTDRGGRVQDYDWDELKKLDAGFMFSPQKDSEFPFRGKGLRVPLLDEVFARFPQMRFIIEIKQVRPAIEESVYRLIRKHRLENQVIVASMHQEPLRGIRRLLPGLATNLSTREALQYYGAYRLGLTNFYRSPGDALQIPPEHNGTPIITRRFVRTAKRKGLTIHIWTVNEVEEMRKLMDAGVDGIITDFPDRLVQLVRETREKWRFERSS